mmetsp:Transcript_11416/g.13088  ORF Transcript_11416/g.13088 Transcript_11416/m.13088 type:complete len:320 (+) Transcript_11416:308-1267(+)
MANPNVDVFDNTLRGQHTVAVLDPKTGAPNVEYMKDSLAGLGDGIAFRQATQLGEAVVNVLTDLPFEQRNKFKISALPEGKQVLKEPCGSEGWKPSHRDLTNLPADMMAVEDSSLCTRLILNCFGCGNLRPLTMYFSTNEGMPGLEVRRPFNLGGWICCPHKSKVIMGLDLVGEVEEDWHCGKNYCTRCFQAACCGTVYHDIKVPTPDGLQKKYKIEVDQCCCISGHFNFCGATPFNNDAIYDIYEYDVRTGSSKGRTAQIQKTYGGLCSCEAFGRCCFQFDNFLMSFPEKATPEDKAVLMAGLIQVEYVLFERTGNES